MADEEVQEAQAPEDIQIDDKRTDEGSAKETAPLGYVISSYGADYTVDGLIKRMREGSVYVVGSGNSEPLIPEILSRSVFGSKVCSRLR